MTGNGLIRTLGAAWRGVVFAGAVLLVVVSWTAFHANRELAASNAVFIEARAYPYPITSLQLATPETSLVDAWEPTPQREIEKYLVLVSSGSCHFCDLNSSYWQDMVRSLKPADHLEVWMIGYDEFAKDDPLMGILKGHMPYKVLRVTNPVLFSLKTGLVATPTTLLVDNRMRPDLAYEGVMTSEILKAFEDEIRRGPTGSDPFLRGGPSQPAPVSKSSSKEKPQDSSGKRAPGR